MINYVLITPAYNEQENLPRLIQSVVNQRKKPLCWVIVNDGSSDGTGDIIDEACRLYEFVKAVHLLRDDGLAYYAHKIYAFNKGYEFLSGLQFDYDVIGNLDADLSFPPEFYNDLLEEYEKDSTLGVAGGMYQYSNESVKVLWGGNYVPGSMLTARRACYEQVQGYRPLKYGAEDTLLCIMAELRGWKVNYFSRCQAVQHRIVGTSGGFSIYKARFRQGQSEYNIGYHPLFAMARFIKRSVKESPYVLGSLFRLSGYLYGWIMQEREGVDDSVVIHLRQKQLGKLGLSRFLRSQNYGEFV